MLIDTLKTKKRLVEELQIPENIAEGIVETVSSADDKVATRDDIALLRKDMEALEDRLTKRIYAVGFIVVAAVAALIPLLT